MPLHKSDKNKEKRDKLFQTYFYVNLQCQKDEQNCILYAACCKK